MKNFHFISIFMLSVILALPLLTSCSKSYEIIEEPDPGIESTDWVLNNPQTYEFSMTYMTQVAFNDEISQNPLTELGAFVDDECRGKVNLEQESGLKIHICHLTIYSNITTGEQIKLLAYDPVTKKIYTSNKTITFQSNTSEGSASAVLNFLP